MKKTIVTLLTVISLTSSLLSIPASAEIMPEVDTLLGETVYIEPDENFIKDNIVNGNPQDSFESESGKTLELDKQAYSKSFIMPVVYLTFAGLLVWLVIIGNRFYKSKK